MKIVGKVVIIVYIYIYTHKDGGIDEVKSQKCKRLKQPKSAEGAK